MKELECKLHDFTWYVLFTGYTQHPGHCPPYVSGSIHTHLESWLFIPLDNHFFMAEMMPYKSRYPNPCPPEYLYRTVPMKAF